MYEFAVAPAVSQIRRRGVEISEVAPLSLGAELELEAGDRIVKVNGRLIRDYLDFRFHSAGETELMIEVRKHSGEDWELQIERMESEDFGLSFEQIVPRQCANECIFCFCNGNPADARPSLFIKDEDVRLSFLYGNYTTLTSLTDDELKRIIEQRLSPQYISVHATDLEVRAYLLGVSKERADITNRFKQLLAAGIEIHAQVVLCPTINDGEILKRTIDDLAREFPRVSSVAIVPLGLTRYNTDKRLAPVTPDFCRQVINELTPLQRQLRKTLGTTFAFLGDEIYLKAGLKVPGRAHYGDYPQIEDGIGMVRSFENSFDRLLKSLDRERLPEPDRLNGTILTGTLFAPALQSKIEELNNRAGTKLKVASVSNEYFGGDVSVAGLLTGGDFVKAGDRIEGDFVIIPKSVLKSDEEIMLDGMTLARLREEIGLPIHPLDMKSLQSFLRSSRN